MQIECPVGPDPMTDQQILNKVNTLERTVQDADDRTLRLGEKVEKLKDSVQTDMNVRLVRVEERTSNIMWAVGIAAAAIFAMAVQLFLMNGRVSGIDSDVRNIGGTVSAIRLKQLLATPHDPASIAEVKQILESAKIRHIRIPEDAVKEAGAKFVEATQTTSDAWGAVEACASYNSITTSPPFDVKHLQGSFGVNWPTHVYRTVSDGEKLYWSGTAPESEAAQLSFLTDKLNAGAAQGPAWLLLVVPEINLEGFRLKNVVVRDAHVVYGGGPVELVNVYFVNCTFDIHPSPQSPRLANTLLKAEAVYFSSGTSSMVSPS